MKIQKFKIKRKSFSTIMSKIIIGDMPKPSLLMVMWETIIGINDIFETVIVESNIIS